MVYEARKQSMPWMDTESSKHVHFRWKIIFMFCPFSSIPNHPKLATISDIFLVFNKIALNPVDFPLPLFNVEYARFSSRFCGRDNIEMGGRGKENKDVRE